MKPHVQEAMDIVRDVCSQVWTHAHNQQVMGDSLVVHMRGIKGIQFISVAGSRRAILRVFETDKPRYDWRSQTGNFSSFIRKGKFDVKLAMFNPDMVSLLNRVAIYEKDPNWIPTRDVPYLLRRMAIETSMPNGDPRPANYIAGELIGKLLSFMLNTSTQNKFLDRMETLRHPQFHYYMSGWGVSDTNQYVTELDVMNLHPMFHPFMNGMNPEHLDKGFIPRDMDLGCFLDSPVYKQSYMAKAVQSIGGVKKALSRHKLSYCVDGADIGEHKFFVITEMPKSVVKYHETGGIYVPGHVFDMYGASRVTGNKSLVKGVFLPQDLQLQAEWPEHLVCSKNVWKGEFTGLEMFGAVELTDRTFAGYPVKGYEVTVPLVITNLIIAYGFSVADEIREDPKSLKDLFSSPTYGEFAKTVYRRYAIADSFAEGDVDLQVKEEDELSTSVYLYVMNQINRDKSFDPVSWLNGAKRDGLIQESNQTTEVKAFDCMNAYRTHGFEVARKFTQSVLQAVVRQDNELNNKLLGNLDTHEIPVEKVQAIARTLFGIDMPGITSKLDPEEMKTRLGDDYTSEFCGRVVESYINGSKNGFNGLMGDQAKTITIQGLQFYIPSKKVMKQFIYVDKDMLGRTTGRYFMNGPAYLANKLFAFIAKYEGMYENIPMAYLKMFYVWYYAKFQSAVFGRFGENVVVPGFANKMIVPCYWSNDTIFCYNKSFHTWNGKTVVFKKNPSLFNNAVHAVNYSNQLAAVFGPISPNRAFALQSCVFVPNTILLAHQNDCDGDLGCVMFLENHGLPVFDGSQLPKYMKKWQNDYETGERDVNLKHKSMVKEPWSAIDEALREALLSKRTIGRATNLANILNVLGLQHYKNKFTPTGDALYMMVQEVIRGVKHESSEDSMLDYLSSVSFRQIYGAVDKDGDDISEYRISDLVERANSQFKHDHDLYLKGLRDQAGYDVWSVRGMTFKQGSHIHPHTEEMKYLSMYVGVVNAYILNERKLVEPNYERYVQELEDGTSSYMVDKYHDIVHEDMSEQFETVCGNLLFCNRLDRPESGSLLELFYMLMGG